MSCKNNVGMSSPRHPFAIAPLRCSSMAHWRRESPLYRYLSGLSGPGGTSIKSRRAQRRSRAPKTSRTGSATASSTLLWSIPRRSSCAMLCAKGSLHCVSLIRLRRCGCRSMQGMTSCCILRMPGILRHWGVSVFVRRRRQTSLQMPCSDGFSKSTLFQCARRSARRFRRGLGARLDVLSHLTHWRKQRVSACACRSTLKTTLRTH